MAKPYIQNESEEQLLLLRDLTKRLGVIHEAQKLQLQYYPVVLFQKAKSFESRIDLEKKDVLFVIQQKGNPDKAFKESCAEIDEWVKWLLGKNWIVRVKLRDKLVYRGGISL